MKQRNREVSTRYFSAGHSQDTDSIQTANRHVVHTSGPALRAMAIPALLLSAVLAITACTSDVVATWAVSSFDALLSATGTTPDTNTGSNTAWELSSPDGDRFTWSRDFSLDKQPDAVLSFDGVPFLNAGLDPKKLPKETYSFDTASGRLSVMAEIGSQSFDADAASTPLGAFKEIIRTNRGSIGYHEELDHYGIDLGGGNMLEWAKDGAKNDKDLVFVLDPEPLLDAGLNAESLAGWKLAAIKKKDGQGRSIEVDKLLKPFDLIK